MNNVRLMERVHHLTNEIYRDMSKIIRHRGVECVALGGLDHAVLLTLVDPLSWNPCPQYGITFCLSLLNWVVTSGGGGVPYLFTSFITTPELSGPLYMSPDIYHSQITEYLLWKAYHRSSVYTLSVLLEHLSRALPTEMIFYLLRSIRSEHLTARFPGKSKLDTLEVIVKWLQGLGSERPSDLYDRFQTEILQYKVLHQL